MLYCKRYQFPGPGLTARCLRRPRLLRVVGVIFFVLLRVSVAVAVPGPFLGSHGRRHCFVIGAPQVGHVNFRHITSIAPRTGLGLKVGEAKSGVPDLVGPQPDC